MKRYTMPWGRANDHIPEHPERTAMRSGTGLNFDITFQVDVADCQANKLGALAVVHVHAPGWPHCTGW